MVTFLSHSVLSKWPISYKKIGDVMERSTVMVIDRTCEGLSQL